MRRVRTIAVQLAVTLVVILGASPSAGGDSGESRSVAVYALSRGKGVPPATRETYQKARALLQELERTKEVGRLDETRIGLEGESRLCAELTDAGTAQDVIEKLRAMARGVELLNVVEERCRKGD